MNSPVYFPGLTSLRGIAALVVLLSHVDQFSYLLKIEPIGIEQFGMAGHAVTLFFVLSGFLITYLLIAEKDYKNKINIKAFYVRRILRIWPAYYLAIFISLLLIYFNVIESPTNLYASAVSYIALLPNIFGVFGHYIRSITPLWSIGVEEQFYAIWPWIVNNSQRLFNSLIAIIFIYLALKISVYFIHPTGALYVIINQTRIDSMAIGGLFSLLFFNNSRFLKVFYNNVIQVIALGCILLPFFTANTKIIANLENEIYSIFFGLIIINLATNKQTIMKIENRFMNFFGEISYGIYVYHMILIFILANFQLFVGVSYYLFASLVFTSTIIVSWGSKFAMEDPILRLKKRFSSKK
jgi:peptidoglycan/LPS O-acetylase OafA/YrhL